tara:strand:+ start:410 stop:823 length:414 start_codon:yes stop_codon:yes gene_type:complete
VYLECTPYKIPKNEPTKDLLVVLVKKEYSEILGRQAEAGVYWFNYKDGNLYDMTYKVNAINIAYKSNVFPKATGIYQTKSRVLIERKTLKTKLQYRNANNRLKTSKKDTGTCKLLSKDEYLKDINEKMKKQEEGNLF